MFRGEFHQKVDGKGRVSVPAAFRRVLEETDPRFPETKRPRFVIVYGDHRRSYLECYSLEAMAEVDAQILAMPRGSIERRIMERLFYTLSHPTEVDEDGRIVLPQKLRDKIALGEEAYFVATADTFQIWKRETFEAEELARTEAYLDSLPEGMDVLSLLPAKAR